jgi:hypothetical protein
MQVSERDSGLRLAELVAAFSLALDLGLGQPMEHVLRAWLIAARLGDHVGLERDQRGSLYYMATLAWVGAGRPALHRLRLAANLIATGGKAIERGMLAHCLTTARMAERIGLGTDVRDPLQHFFTRWDGKGVPGGVGGEDIAPPCTSAQSRSSPSCAGA